MSSTCKFCGKEIFWLNLTGLWTPYDDKACSVRHDCRTRREPVFQQATLEPFTPTEVQPLKKLVQCLPVMTSILSGSACVVKAAE